MIQILNDFTRNTGTQQHLESGRFYLFHFPYLSISFLYSLIFSHLFSIISYGMQSCRIDGSVTGRDRQHIIDSFNEGAYSKEKMRRWGERKSIKVKRLQKWRRLNIFNKSKKGKTISKKVIWNLSDGEDRKGWHLYRPRGHLSNFIVGKKFYNELKRFHIRPTLYSFFSIFFYCIHLNWYSLIDAESEDEQDDSKWASENRNMGGGTNRRGMGPSICLLTTKACGQGITLTGKFTSTIF